MKLVIPAKQASVYILGICIGVFASPFSRAEIYRVIDDAGNVTFTDQPPENAKAENIQKEVEEAIERNSAQSLNTQRENDPDWVKQAREDRAKIEAEQQKEKDRYLERKREWNNALKAARKNLKEAKLAQEKGKEAIEGDFIGKAGGGARPSEQYFNRQEALAKRVEQAEKALKRIRKSKPKK